MNQNKKRNAVLVAAAVIFLISLAVTTAAVHKFTADDAPSPVAQMRVEATASDKQYCADFVADEIDDDQIEITITNCGDHTIKVKHGKVMEKLGADEEYSIKLRADTDKFHATITNPRDDYIGGFGL